MRHVFPTSEITHKLAHATQDDARNPLRFRYYKGVRYVASWRPAPAAFARCNTCGRAWDDDKPTGLTPAPSGRCPFEYMHTKKDAT